MLSLATPPAVLMTVARPADNRVGGRGQESQLETISRNASVGLSNPRSLPILRLAWQRLRTAARPASRALAATGECAGRRIGRSPLCSRFRPQLQLRRFTPPIGHDGRGQQRPPSRPPVRQAHTLPVPVLRRTAQGRSEAPAVGSLTSTVCGFDKIRVTFPNSLALTYGGTCDDSTRRPRFCGCRLHLRLVL